MWRSDAAQRWHDGPFGPDDVIAHQAQAHCVTCGFYVPLAGLLGMALGACSNEYSPADGRVVDADYGCGAHSDTVIDAPLMSASSDTVIDELTLEVHSRPAPAAPMGLEVGLEVDLGVEPDVRWPDPTALTDPLHGAEPEAGPDGEPAADPHHPTP